MTQYRHSQGGRPSPPPKRSPTGRQTPTRRQTPPRSPPGPPPRPYPRSPPGPPPHLQGRHIQEVNTNNARNEQIQELHRGQQERENELIRIRQLDLQRIMELQRNVRKKKGGTRKRSKSKRKTSKQKSRKM